MRNPWVHDDMPDDAGGGYDGGVRRLAAVVWGILFCAVGGFVVLSGAGLVDFADGGSLGSVLTGVVTALALALALPIVLKLLAVSRVLATAALLGTGGLVSRFVIAREPERIEAVLAARERVAENAGAVGELLDALNAAAPEAVDAVVALSAVVPLV